MKILFLISVLLSASVCFSSGTTMTALEIENDPSFGPAIKDFVRTIKDNFIYRTDLFTNGKVDNPEKPLIAAHIPKGRSLERAYANNQNPRLITEFKQLSDVFLGYTALNNQIQIIGFNSGPKNGEVATDFLLIDDFAPGKSPRFTKPEKGLCLACHQKSGPIFPGNAWRELTRDNIVGNAFHQLNPIAKRAVDKYTGSPTNTGFGFDRSIRTHARKTRNVTMCSQVCSGNMTCKRNVIREAFRLRNKTEYMDKISQVGYGHGTEQEKLFVDFSTGVSKRFIDEVKESVRNYNFRNFLPTGSTISESGAENSGDQLKFPVDADPLQRRELEFWPESLGAPRQYRGNGTATGFAPPSEDDRIWPTSNDDLAENVMFAAATGKCLMSTPSTDRDKLILEVNKVFDSNFEQLLNSREFSLFMETSWLPNLDEMAAFFKKYQNVKALNNEKKESQAETEIVSKPEAKDGRGVFFQKCYICHFPKAPAGEIPIDAKAMKSFVGIANESRRVEYLVGHDLMPPRDSKFRLSENEKKLLLEYVSGN